MAKVNIFEVEYDTDVLMELFEITLEYVGLFLLEEKDDIMLLGSIFEDYDCYLSGYWADEKLDVLERYGYITSEIKQKFQVMRDMSEKLFQESKRTANELRNSSEWRVVFTLADEIKNIIGHCREMNTIKLKIFDVKKATDELMERFNLALTYVGFYLLQEDNVKLLGDVYKDYDYYLSEYWTDEKLEELEGNGYITSEIKQKFQIMRDVSKKLIREAKVTENELRNSSECRLVYKLADEIKKSSDIINNY